MKSEVFFHVLEMSLEASIIIFVVFIMRLFLSEKPKVFSYVLWSVVFIRLLCPISIEIPASFVPESISSGKLLKKLTDTYAGSQNIYWNYSEKFDDALEQGADLMISEEDGAEGFGAYVVIGEGRISEPNTIYNTTLPMLSNLWLAGAVGVFGYGLLNYCKFKKKLVGAVPYDLEQDIYLSDYIDTAFVIGFFYPKIYLPSSLEKQEQKYILLHEQQHIRRKDHMIKIVAFMALCIHWFNPFVWLAFLWMTEDMEMSCDEAVLNKLGYEIRKEYAASLLRLTAGRKTVVAMPLAFGEGDTRERIHNVMNWKKATAWTMVVTSVICLLVGTVSLAETERASLSHPYEWTSTVTVEDIDNCTATSWEDKLIEFSITEAQIADFVYVLNHLEKYNITKEITKSKMEVSVLLTCKQQEVLLTYGEGITRISFDTETSLGLEQKVWQTDDRQIANAMENLIKHGEVESEIEEVAAPTEEKVLKMREKVLEGMSEEEMRRLTELVKVENQRLEYKYLRKNRFSDLQDKDSAYWKIFTQSGTIQLGWGITCDAPGFDPEGEMTEEEYYEMYGTPFVMEIEVSEAERFYSLIDELRSLVKNDLLKADFDDLEDSMRLAVETQDVNYLYRIYYKLHDLDYFLLRYGPKDVGKYTIDDSTVNKFYNVLFVYERRE